ncbi:energy transducer TonB [Mucilaginibacter sp. BT774]|uniref:energy transducer TonB n=1 Tax=Mucilaginibacter sp. BT774 TaxID=3062276 RepID=UPI0026754C2F|nr:energy transducer TonB [Mucilaginibacter sp. BT774]MDO3624904.1 energy transducer TonB [Mucilaginibacter sp. BT774]
MEYYQEENNYPKAFLATGIIMGILIALCYFIVFHNPPPQEMGTGGILVNYGTTNEGMGDDYMSTEEPSKSERPNHTKPTKITKAPVTPQKTQEAPSDKKVVTQTTEDAPEVKDNAKKPTTAPVSQAIAKPAKPTLNQNALYKGKPTGGTGNGDGTTNTPGNQGSPNGSNLSNNYNGTGSGNGGLALANRSWVSRPTVDDNHRTTGVIMVQIQVDKNGNVVSATPGAKGTTVSDYELFNRCKEAALNAKFNPSDNAPDLQVGYIKFTFRVK